MNALEMRKQLLIAESELNRVQLSDEWRKLTADISVRTHRTKTFAIWSSFAAMLMSGLAGFRRPGIMAGDEKPPWLQRVLEWGRLASSLWQSIPRSPEMTQPRS